MIPYAHNHTCMSQRPSLNRGFWSIWVVNQRLVPNRSCFHKTSQCTFFFIQKTHRFSRPFPWTKSSRGLAGLLPRELSGQHWGHRGGAAIPLQQRWLSHGASAIPTWGPWQEMKHQTQTRENWRFNSEEREIQHHRLGFQPARITVQPFWMVLAKDDRAYEHGDLKWDTPGPTIFGYLFSQGT